MEGYVQVYGEFDCVQYWDICLCEYVEYQQCGGYVYQCGVQGVVLFGGVVGFVFEEQCVVQFQFVGEDQCDEVEQ